MINLQLLNESTTKLARIAPTWGIEAGVLNRWSMLEIVEFLGLPPLIPLLQCVNWLGLRFVL